jgi:asparagine synthase (glutamine-hydrolysing)
MRRRIASALHRLSPRQWDQLYDTLDTRLPASIRQTHVGDKMSRLADAIRAPTSDELYRGLVSQWQDPSRIVRNGHELSTWLDRDIGARNVAFDERMMFLDFVSYLPDDILTKLDRATMAVGLEGRAPLLDHRVVEWTWRLPMSLKRRGGASKWLLRQVLYRYVPAPLIERPKMGFGVPIGDWIRGPLREWAEALLDSRRLHAEGYFDPTAVRAAWDDHTCGRSNEQYRLWTVLMFQAWLERWNSSRGRQAEPLASPAYIG